MAALSVADDARASDVGGATDAPSPTTSSPASAAAIVALAAGLLSLNRFGGLVTQAPRAFVRLALVVVWGWIGLSVAIWLVVAVLERRRPRLDDLPPTLGGVGRAHMPLVALAVIMFVFAGALQVRFPVMLATIGVVGWWFPRSISAGAGIHVGTGSGGTGVDGTDPIRAPVRAIATATAYVAWAATVGRHLLTQLGHLI